MNKGYISVKETPISILRDYLEGAFGNKVCISEIPDYIVPGECEGYDIRALYKGTLNRVAYVKWEAEPRMWGLYNQGNKLVVEDPMNYQKAFVDTIKSIIKFYYGE